MGVVGILFQVDGIEDDKLGLDLYEMTDVLLAMGMDHAVVRHMRAVDPAGRV